jgi:hypothetical protein
MNTQRLQSLFITLTLTLHPTESEPRTRQLRRKSKSPSCSIRPAAWAASFKPREKRFGPSPTPCHNETGAAHQLALVAYRDRGEAYITKRTDLTDDLDAVYKELMSFQAEGGGDEPESVNQALDEAVTKLSGARTTDLSRALPGR